MDNRILYTLGDRHLYEGYYLHFKGKYYYVYGVAEHTETGETMVIYKALYGECKTYVREVSMFLSEVDKEKYPEVQQIFRFTRISEEEYNSYELSNRTAKVVNIKK